MRGQICVRLKQLKYTQTIITNDNIESSEHGPPDPATKRTLEGRALFETLYSVKFICYSQFENKLCKHPCDGLASRSTPGCFVLRKPEVSASLMGHQARTQFKP